MARRQAERWQPHLKERLEQSRAAKAETRLRLVTATPRPAPAPPPRQRAIIDTRATGLNSIGFDQGTGNSQTIWTSWTSNTTAGSSITAADLAWRGWIQIGVSGTATSNTIVTTWNDWNGPPQRARALNEATDREWRQRQAAMREDEQKRTAKRDAAAKRAIDLLMSVLDDEQQRSMMKDSCFYVSAPSGRLYRIDKGTHGNVKVVDRLNRSRVLERLCIQPEGVPAGDAMVMQKLMIETAEDAFRAHANITMESGAIVYGAKELLTHERLAKVIQLKRAAA